MDFREVPIGFSMALAQNEAAVNAYAMMTRAQKKAILDKAHHARSEREMQSIVDALAKEQMM